jgi:hypothetical protein
LLSDSARCKYAIEKLKSSNLTFLKERVKEKELKTMKSLKKISSILIPLKNEKELKYAKTWTNKERKYAVLSKSACKKNHT